MLSCELSFRFEYQLNVFLPSLIYLVLCPQYLIHVFIFYPLESFQEMTRGNRYKTIRWRFVESLELPRVVHARCPNMVSKGNLYGQVTVRMHSRQVGARKTRTVEM